MKIHGRSTGIALQTLFSLVPHGSANARAEPSICEYDRRIEVGFGAAEDSLGAQGASARTTYSVEFSGRLHVSVETSGDGDPFLRIEDQHGVLLGEDDDSGNGKSAYLALDAIPGTALSIIVARGANATVETLWVKVAAAPESEPTLAVAAAVTQDLADLQAEMARGNDAAARSRLPAMLEQIDDTPGSRFSDALSKCLWSCGAAAHRLSLDPLSGKAWKGVCEHRTRILPPQHTMLLSVQLDLSIALRRLGDLPAAAELSRSAWEACERTQPMDNRGLQAARLTHANVLIELGDYAAARDLSEKAVTVLSRVLDEGDGFLLDALACLGTACSGTGDLWRARTLEERVLEGRLRTLPEDDIDVQRARGNLAITLGSLGDDEATRALEEKVLEVWSRTLPDDAMELQIARMNLAVMMSDTGELASALVLQQEALSVLERTLDARSPKLQAARIGFGILQYQSGNYARAREIYEQTLQVLSQTLREDHPVLLGSRQNLALTLAELGDWDGARAQEERVMACLTRTLPPEDPNLQSARFNLANTAAGAGDVATAERLAKELCAAARVNLDRLLLTSSPREAALSYRRTYDVVSVVLSIAEGYGRFDPLPALDREAFHVLVGSQAVDVALARALRDSDDAQTVTATIERTEVAASRLLRAASRADSAEEIRVALTERDRIQRDALERLSKQPSFARERTVLTPESLAASLAANQRLVVYWHGSSLSRAPDPPAQQRRMVKFYAFVVDPQANLSKVDLGSSRPILDAVTAWRRAICLGSDTQPAAAGTIAEAGRVLRRLILDPLEPALGSGAEHLTLCLDGALHTIPLDALPATDDPKSTLRVGDVRNIEVRTSARELLVAPPHRAGPAMLVALGDAAFAESPVEFSAPEALAAADGGEPVRDSHVRRESTWNAAFSRLAHTGDEVNEIRSLFDQVFDRHAEAVVLAGRRASKPALEALSGRARFLHIATHGWYAPDSIRSVVDPAPLDLKLDSIARMTTRDQVSHASPMLLCGLALAGANLPPDALGFPPGIITAEEIATWNLSNCELAVLSACDTNVGVMRSGQGVFSLQKALQMAGARSVVTSLWKVPDHATKVLMLEFYRHVWLMHESKRAALWAAKRHLRDMLDAAGKPVYSERDWAAWILTGEPN